jgi:hypothetical protein
MTIREYAVELRVLYKEIASESNNTNYFGPNLAYYV